MLFQKPKGFHNLVLYLQKEEPQPLYIVIPSEVANDVISTMKKFEKSSLNHPDYIGGLGPFTIVHDIQGLSKISIHNDTLPWSEPMLYTDYAKFVAERLQAHVDEDTDQDTNDVEEELIYFIGEFTMMQDNGFTAPF